MRPSPGVCYTPEASFWAPETACFCAGDQQVGVASAATRVWSPTGFPQHPPALSFKHVLFNSFSLIDHKQTLKVVKNIKIFAYWNKVALKELIICLVLTDLVSTQRTVVDYEGFWFKLYWPFWKKSDPYSYKMIYTKIIANSVLASMLGPFFGNELFVWLFVIWELTWWYSELLSHTNNRRTQQEKFCFMASTTHQNMQHIIILNLKHLDHNFSLL